jgi:hypothetical protein
MAERSARSLWLLAVLGAGLLLQGCREDEQDRLLLYDKGTYLGQKQPPLDAQQVDALRLRAQNQKY